MTPKWHQTVRQRLQTFATELGIGADEQPVFADWLPDGDDVATAHNILDEQPPPAPAMTCQTHGPDCPNLADEREAVDLEWISDHAADLAYAEAVRAWEADHA